MIEKRNAPRHKCFLRAFVYFEGRSTAVDCIVRDISEIGARLQFHESVALTELLDLHIPSKGKNFRAEKRWRDGEQIGVTFDPASKANTADPGVEKRVDRLRAEVTLLKKTIKHLQKNTERSPEEV